MHRLSKARILFFSRVNEQGTCFTAVKEDGGDRRLVQIELAFIADDVAPPDPG